MAGRDARPTVLNITFYLKTPISRATHRVRPYNNGYTNGVMVLCRADHTGWHRTTHYRTTIFPNCFALVAQASLPAIGLWMFLQRLPMAGRDAHPTVLNITFYLKTPICARPPDITGSNFSDHL